MPTSKGKTPQPATENNHFHSDLSTKQHCISHAKKHSSKSDLQIPAWQIKPHPTQKVIDKGRRVKDVWPFQPVISYTQKGCQTQ
jgi:hypothetical protein